MWLDGVEDVGASDEVYLTTSYWLVFVPRSSLDSVLLGLHTKSQTLHITFQEKRN